MLATISQRLWGRMVEGVKFQQHGLEIEPMNFERKENVHSAIIQTAQTPTILALNSAKQLMVIVGR